MLKAMYSQSRNTGDKHGAQVSGNGFDQYISEDNTPNAANNVCKNGFSGHIEQTFQPVTTKLQHWSSGLVVELGGFGVVLQDLQTNSTVGQ